MQGNLLKVFNTYLVSINQANGFKTHNELTMCLLGNYPLAPSDTAFLRIRNIPAEEVELALSARMTALRGRLSDVSVKEDCNGNMKDAEGEPASDVEAGKN